MNSRDIAPPTYFELVETMYTPEGRDGWTLQGPFDEQGARLANPWKYCMGERLEVENMTESPTFRIAQPAGSPLDFNISALGTPVVTPRVVRLFEQLGVQDVQFLPTRIVSIPEPWFILNPIRVVRCIDDARSRHVDYFKPEDGQPKKVGTYRAVHGMRIDPIKAGGARIFRPWGWLVALVVAKDLKEVLEQEHVTGARFVEV